MTLLPVENHQGLYRDLKTNAIVNRNSIEYENYVKQRESRKIKNQKINELEEQINILKEDLSEIKSLIKLLIQK